MFSVGRKVNSSISGEQLEGRWPGLGALLSSHKASMTSPLVKPQGQPLGTTALTGSRARWLSEHSGEAEACDLGIRPLLSGKVPLQDPLPTWLCVQVPELVPAQLPISGGSRWFGSF